MKIFVATIALFLSGAIVSNAADDLTGIKCIVNGNAAAKKDQSSEYLGAKVYFCCGRCKAKFDAAPESFTIKANHQLALTGQYVQVNCPMGGKPPVEGATCKVGGVEVGFCCMSCMTRVDETENLEEKAKIVFSKKAFKTGFIKKPAVDIAGVKCMMMSKKNVNADYSVDHQGGKVYFCCKMCAKAFEKDRKKFLAQANQQLVRTGQFVQSGCPFSGGDVDDEQMVKVGGVKVKLCCGNCVKKVKSAADDKAKAELVFNAKAFKKGFKAKSEK